MCPVNRTDSLQKRGENLYEVTTQIGCGIKRFEKTGRAQLESLIRHGLNPWDKLLDIGCGALCGGYWMINYLRPGCYFGVEPNTFMFNAGVEHLVEEGLFEAKQPGFLHNDQYDFSGFGEKFDYFHARITKAIPGSAVHTNRTSPGFAGTVSNGYKVPVPPGILMSSCSRVKKSTSKNGY